MAPSDADQPCGTRGGRPVHPLCPGVRLLPRPWVDQERVAVLAKQLGRESCVIDGVFELFFEALTDLRGGDSTLLLVANLNYDLVPRSDLRNWLRQWSSCPGGTTDDIRMQQCLTTELNKGRQCSYKVQLSRGTWHKH